MQQVAFTLLLFILWLACILSITIW